MKADYAAKFDCSYLVLSNAGFDQNWTMFFIYFFVCFEDFERNDDK